MCGPPGGRSAGPDGVVGIQVAKRVLVVDDVAEMRTLIQRVLSADGYQVDVAATLAEARGLDPAGYSAVLVDAHLGSEHGIDLIEELRSADPAAARRCVMITGAPADAGAADLAFLAKPFQAADLLDAVRTLPQPAPRSQIRPRRALPGTGRCGRTRCSPPDLRRLVRAPPVPGRAAPSRDRPAPSPAQIRHLLAVTRRLRAREHRELVDFLHDGPIQELTAGTLEAEMMRKSAPAGPVPRSTPCCGSWMRRRGRCAGWSTATGRSCSRRSSWPARCDSAARGCSPSRSPRLSTVPARNWRPAKWPPWWTWPS